MARLQRSIHGQKVGCQPESWQRPIDFEKVLGYLSMNTWTGFATHFDHGNPHAYCGCGGQVNACCCNLMSLIFSIGATPFPSMDQKREEANTTNHHPPFASDQFCHAFNAIKTR